MKKTRAFKTRNRESVTRRQLDADVDSGRSLVPRGDICINPNLSNVRLDRLRCYKAGRTVIRIWPMLDPEDPGNTLLNGRLSPYDLAGLGGMSISEPVLCVQFAGINRESKLLKDPNDANQCSYIIARSKHGSCEGVSFWNLPYPKLYVTAKSAKKAGEFGNGRAWNPKWNILLDDKMSALSSFKQKFFVVCSVYENGPSLDLTRERLEYKKDGKDVVEDIDRHGIPLGEAAGDPLIVMGLSVSAGKKLLALCCIEKADWEGDEAADPALPFKYGDPTGKFDHGSNTVQKGLFFTIYNPEKVVIEKNSSFKGIANPNIIEYEVAVSGSYTGPSGKISPSLTSEQVDNVFNKHLFLWKDSDEDPADSYLLHEPSIEERCVMLAKAFKPVPDLLRFCWMSNPEYLAFPDVAAVLNSKVAVSVVKPEENEGDETDEEVPFDNDDEPVTTTSKTKVSSTTKQAPVSEKKKLASELASEFDAEFDDDEVDEDELDEDDDEFDDDAEENDEADVADVADVASDVVDAEGDDTEEDEVSGEFNEFDDEKTEAGEGDGLEDQLETSLAKAKAMARSRKRNPTASSANQESTKVTSAKVSPAATTGNKKKSK